MNPSSLVGHRLREERSRLDMLQVDAAEAAGVSREMWGRYERGAMPGADVLLRLMNLGFDLHYVLVGERKVEDESTLNEQERKLLHNFRLTDDDGRAALLRSSKIEAERVAGAGRS